MNLGGLVRVGVGYDSVSVSEAGWSRDFSVVESSVVDSSASGSVGRPWACVHWTRILRKVCRCVGGLRFEV